MLEGRYKNGREEQRVTDDSRGLHWSASELWMTKYGAVRVPPACWEIVPESGAVRRVWHMNV